MGCYDTFMDKHDEVQLKNFGSCMTAYHVGDEVPMKECGYPEDGIFFCFAVPELAVVVKDSKFIKICTLEKAANDYDFKIWDCGGQQYKRKTIGKAIVRI